MRRCWLVIALCALGAATTAVTALGAGADDGPGPREFGGPLPRFGGPGLYGGRYFVVACDFSHRNNDDAIVFPRQPRQSHNHTYFGNRSTNAFSTPASLRSKATSCRIRGDTAAYWVPTLLDNGRAVEPLGATIFYVRRTVAGVRPFPAGLKMVAGNAAASSPQSHRLVFWTCGFRFGAVSSAIPSCSEGGRSGLQLHVNYPNCWNGRSLDSADHKGHMAYSVDGRCPGSHPMELPAITLIVHYPSSGGEGTALSSGSRFSAHGDFVNAWDQDTLERLVDRHLD